MSVLKVNKNIFQTLFEKIKNLFSKHIDVGLNRVKIDTIKFEKCNPVQIHNNITCNRYRSLIRNK